MRYANGREPKRGDMLVCVMRDGYQEANGVALVLAVGEKTVSILGWGPRAKGAPSQEEIHADNLFENCVHVDDVRAWLAANRPLPDLKGAQNGDACEAFGCLEKSVMLRLDGVAWCAKHLEDQLDRRAK